MRKHRWATAIIASVLTISLAPTAAADPVSADGDPVRPAAERGTATSASRFRPSEPAQRLPAKPRNDVIVDVPVNPNDASIPLNLVPYHGIAPKLRALQASDRISVEIIGQSTLGRDLHLVVATSPMTDAEWAEWERLSDLRTDDPHAAIELFEAGGYDDWKRPAFVNNNIHGNEWEGTDAALETLDMLAHSDDPEIAELLDNNIFAFIVTHNPDGRVNATRANANGFDMNRDYITQSQPENRAVRDQMIRYNPLTMLDQHGYVAWTLIEPTTGPHGDNYEYDLYIRNALRHALAMEEAVLATGEPNRIVGGQYRQEERTRIPFRDNTSGWDDWPPIFTPMYAMYHGAIGHTIEFPHNPRGVSNVADRHERTRINTVIARATIESSFEWLHENRDSVLADQLELYRRGVDNAPQRPIDDPLAIELALGNNILTEQIEFPSAYVIPRGDSQRSETAAARLVQFLVDNDIEVLRTTTPSRLGGTIYPAGSYVVDVHQAKRGLVNTILSVGRDVTNDFPTMYDISAWSLGALWGADVDVIEDGTIDTRRMRQVGRAEHTGSVPAGRRTHYGFEVDSAAGIRAVNHLLASDVDLTRTADGLFVVDGSDLADVQSVADEFGIEFVAVTAAHARRAVPFDTHRIGLSAANDEAFALTGLGFDVTTVNHTGFNNGSYSFDDFDALYIGSTSFNPLNLNATQQAAFADWLADGGSIVGRGSAGVTFNTRADLLPVSVATGRSDANGIVEVVNNPASPITGDGALTTVFVSSPRYFTSTGPDVRVDQRLVDGDFFLAGHWVGQEAAAGHPVVVSGTARGANVTLFGTEPLYRAHPEGMFTQVADALWWNGN